MNKKIIGLFLLICLVALFGCTQTPIANNEFSKLEGSICTEDGKPVIRMYSTTTCPHCLWVKSTFDSVAKEYVDANKIVAYHWEWDYDATSGTATGDNTLTPINEGEVPTLEENVFNQFSPKGYVPAFVVGCRYYRIGNKFEAQKDLNAERAGFVKIFDQIVNDSK